MFYRSFIFFRNTLIIFSLVSSACHSTITETVDVHSKELGDFKLVNKNSTPVEYRVIEINDLPFSEALQVETLGIDEDPFGVAVAFPLKTDLKEGESVLLVFHFRSLKGRYGKNSWLNIAVAPPNDVWSNRRLTRFVIQATPEWQKIQRPLKVKRDIPNGSISLLFGLGQEERNIEIAGARLIPFPAETPYENIPFSRLSYDGREKDAPWRQDAETRIARIRMADLSLTIIDKTGKPIPDAKISIQMKTHAFPFGTAVNERILAFSNEPELFPLPAETSPEKASRYLKEFKQNFNAAVTENGLKWHRWENPEYHFETVSSLDWMKKQGLYVRGNALLWPDWRRTPPDVKLLEDHPDEMRHRIAAHIMTSMTALNGKVDCIDLLDEPYTHKRLLEIAGENSLGDFFKIARKAAPDIKLFINENEIHAKADNLERLVNLIRRDGGQVDGVGFQSHFQWGPASPQEIFERFDRFGKLGLEIQVTEYDMIGPDDDLKADFLRDFLTASFSHENVTAFLIGGFRDQAHFAENSPLYDNGWNLKKSGKAWRDLVYGKWWTDEKGTTDQQGKFKTRVFKGTHLITVDANGEKFKKTIKINKDVNFQIKFK